MNNYTRPDFSSIALITIDTQRDFLAGQPFEIPGTSEVLPQMRRLVEAFRHAHLPIVHVVRLYRADGSNADACRRDTIEKGTEIVCPDTPGSQLAPELLPEPNISLNADLLLSGSVQVLGPMDWVIYKPRWGAFYQTPLEQHLAGLKVTSLAFCGCNYPNCPRTSIYEASERDFRIILAVDATSGPYERGRVEMANIGVELMNSGAIIKSISKP
jgi:nicotinamidase-related amidase